MGIEELNLPKQLTQILDRLVEYGYSAYICGPCVRQLIKGQTLLDFDLFTNAEVKRVHAVFDTENFHINDSEELVVSVLGVAASVVSYVNLDYELKKRNAFTYDALAYSPQGGIHDPFNGLSCLENGEIKRLILTNDTTAIVLSDLEQILMSRHVKEILSEHREIFISMIPELAMLDEDLLQHTFASVGASSPILNLRYALLFHELGKPDCYSKSWDDTLSFRGHAERSRIYARRIMSRFGLKMKDFGEDIAQVEYIIKNYESALTAEESSILDTRDAHPQDMLKLLLLFNCARFRAKGDEHTALSFKKLSKMI
jgi:tRNA nucleotidyltransferase (CCA-adding enzyme)